MDAEFVINTLNGKVQWQDKSLTKLQTNYHKRYIEKTSKIIT